GRREGRLRPPQAGRAHGGAARPRGGVPRALPGARASRRRPSGRGASRGGGRGDDRRAGGARRRAARRGPPPQVGPRRARPGAGARARGIDPRELETDVERISLSLEETFARDVADRERLHDELRRMAVRLAEFLRGRGQTARTVTTKLRYPDFAIRTRSTSLPAGTDDAARIGELACALLDRGLSDRPGPLRLVGRGGSAGTEHDQLALAVEA